MKPRKMPYAAIKRSCRKMVVQPRVETPLDAAMATACFFGCLILVCLLLFAFQ